MSNQEVEAIRASQRAFDIDSNDEALAMLDAMAGYSDMPTEEIIENANGNLSLDDALALIQFRESSGWKLILEGLQNLAATLQNTTEDTKNSRDARLSAMDQLLGVKSAMALIGNIFSEGQQRVSNLSSTEKVLIGREGTEVIKQAQRVAPTVADVETNTKAAVDFLSKGRN